MLDFDEIRDRVQRACREYMFPIGLILFQCAFIVLYAVHGEYQYKQTDSHSYNSTESDHPAVGDIEFYYSFFQDVHVMMFIGFGFLMTFLRRYSFSSVSFNFLVAAFVLEWAILIRGYVFDWNSHSQTFSVSIKSLLHADFVCAAILISFGAVLGKTNPAQLVILALIEVVIQVWNEYIGLTYFCVYDAGEYVQRIFSKIDSLFCCHLKTKTGRYLSMCLVHILVWLRRFRCNINEQ